MGTLTTVRVATKDGCTRTRTQQEPLSESALLRAGTSIMSQEPDDTGWTVVALRVAL